MSCQDCNNCVRFKCLVLPQCPGDEDTFTLAIGTFEELNKDYFVYFSNDSNDVTQHLIGSTDGTGLLRVELTGLIPYLTDKTTFTVWVTTENDQLHANVTFLYEGGDAEAPATCATIRFEKVFDVAGFPYNILNQTLSI